MSKGGSYTIKKGDFWNVNCAKAIDNSVTLPKTYNFIEFTKSILIKNLSEN